METVNPTREALARSVITAAERGDRLAFSSAAGRYGSLQDAQELVRNKAVLRMADRVVSTVGGAHLLPPATVRSADGEGVASDTLYGHFTVWDAWYEVNSLFEGHFLERTVRGSAKKTLRENRDSIRALFQHGTDPVVGDKPLGAFQDLREDDIGGYYEVPLLRGEDGELVDYVRAIAPGIAAGLYGASFRFRPMREFWDDAPDVSEHNPNGLPERSLKEMQIMELGPVTFPASRAATASLRTAAETDEETRDGLEESAEDSVEALDVEQEQIEGGRSAAATPVVEDAETIAHPRKGAGPSHLNAARRGVPYTLGTKEEPSWRL